MTDVIPLRALDYTIRASRGMKICLYCIGRTCRLFLRFSCGRAKRKTDVNGFGSWRSSRRRRGIHHNPIDQKCPSISSCTSSRWCLFTPLGPFFREFDEVLQAQSQPPRIPLSSVPGSHNCSVYRGLPLPSQGVMEKPLKNLLVTTILKDNSQRRRESGALSTARLREPTAFVQS